MIYALTEYLILLVVIVVTSLSTMLFKKLFKSINDKRKRDTKHAIDYELLRRSTDKRRK